MSSYTAVIPQPEDDPSDSQDQILQNFETLNESYGTSGDHFPWTNTGVATEKRHAKVTLPGLPIANNPPGDVLPAPASGNCAIFAQTQVGVPSNQTTPFLIRDGFTTNWSLMPIKAYASFAVAAAPGVIVPNDQFNVTTVEQLTSSSWKITLSHPMRTSTYGIISMSTLTTTMRYDYDGVSPTTIFTLFSAAAIVPPRRITFIVLEA